MTFDHQGRLKSIRKRIRLSRKGLVIREIVALTIIPWMLISLLLPAVQNVREAASRMKCGNNLKQQAIAMHNFESAFGHFPAGCSEVLGGPPKVTDGKNLYAWGAVLLPYLEADNTYTALSAWSTVDLEQNFQQAHSRSALEASIDTFRCPSDSAAPLLNVGRSFELPNGENAPIALSNYVASNGSGDLKANGDSGGANGLFYLNSMQTLGRLTAMDGSSNTILIGERAWSRRSGVKYRSRGAVVCGVRSTREASFYGLADALAAGRFQVNFDAIKQPDGLGESYLRRGFSSNHVGGAQFALADGSIRFIPRSIDADMDSETQCTKTPEVDSAWEALLSCNDGQSFPE